MNEENLKKDTSISGEIDPYILKMFQNMEKIQPKSQQYQYGHVDLETVIQNPDEFIIPECKPACMALWSKNIETFMVSNQDDRNLYILLANLSDENKLLLQKYARYDVRYYYDEFRKTYGIRVENTTEDAMLELLSLTDIFRTQDTVRYQTTEAFLKEFRTTNGELYAKEDGTLHRKENPELKNITLEEALKRTGKTHLYVPSEGRIYQSSMFLNWHKRYQQSLIEDTIYDLTPYKDNIDGEIAHLRDTFIHAEREYVMQLLQKEEIRKLIGQLNGRYTPEALYEEAMRLIEEVEMGLIPQEQMELIEQKLTVLLAAIQDKVLQKELVLLPTYKTSRSH